MTALSEAVVAATAAVTHPLYAVNAVPAAPRYPYGVWSAVMGRGDAYTLDGTHGLRWGRVTGQFFGKTAESAALLAEDFIAQLLDRRLQIAGHETTPCALELDPAIVRDPDHQGVVGVTTTLTFTATTTP